MINNNNNENKEQIHLEPILAVFVHKNQYYVTTPDHVTEEYKQSLGALLNKIFEDTPEMFEELKKLINDKDFNNEVN